MRRALLGLALLGLLVLSAVVDTAEAKKPKKRKSKEKPVEENWDEEEANPRGQSQSAMVFATFKPWTANPSDKMADANALAVRWKDLLFSAGMDSQIFAIEEDKLLLVVSDQLKVPDVMKFVLNQDETVVFEWNQQKFYPEKKDKKDSKSSSGKKKKKTGGSA
eukprot:tig00001029_g6416.t1